MIHLPTEVSIALHMYSQELSGRRVFAERTTAVRTIANIIVMTTSEKMPARAAFLRRLICTPHNIVIGIDMTIDMLTTFPCSSMDLLKKSVRTSHVQFSFRLIC